MQNVGNITLNADKTIKNKSVRSLLHIFTEMGSTIGAVVIILILTLITGLEILYVFIPIYIFQLICVELLKLALRKPRPDNKPQKNVFGLTATSGSFPSGHTSNIFTLAFLISNFYQLNVFFIAIVFIIAGAIGFSRVLLNRHYTIDVAAGAIAGTILAYIGAAFILPAILPLIVAVFPLY